MIGRLKNYLKGSFEELKKAKWLSKKETFDLTVDIIIFALLFVFIYGIFDSIFLRFLFIFK